MSQASTIKLRDGSERRKLSLTIGDESNICIGITLWGPVTEAHNYSVGQIVAFKSCRISDYNGKSLNASSHVSDVFIGNIRHKRAQELQSWLDAATV